MSDRDNDFGEVIMGNSPFAEYLKDLQNNSELNVDVDPILSQILPPPPPPPPPPPQPQAPDLSLSSPSPPLPPLSPSLPLREGASIEKIKGSMYHKMYNYIVGSELLHPEESLFLCEDENSDNSMKLKPEIDTLQEYDPMPNWTIMKNQVVTRLHAQKRIVVLLALPVIVFFLALHRPLLGFGFAILLGVASLIVVTSGYYFLVQYVLNCQAKLENKVQESIECSKKHDANLLKVMKSIQEVELIARGYRLSTPLSPIERLEQNAKSRKSLHMRAKTETSIAQSRRILRENSSKFLDFLPLELSAVFGPKIAEKQEDGHAGELTLTELKAAFYQYFVERSRFYSLVLLSFHAVTHLPTTQAFWKQYKDIVHWQNQTGQAISGWLLHLQNDIVELKTCVSTEFWANQILQRVLLNKTQRTVHERFLQQSKDLKLLLQGIIARAALCEENIHKTNANDKEADVESKTALAELVEQYQIIRKDLAQSLDLWDSGNILLLKLIDSLSKGPEDAQFKELRNLVKDGPPAEATEEPITPAALELIRTEPDENEEEQLFEAYTGPLLSDSESEEEPTKPPPPVVSFVPGVPPPPPPMGLKFVSKKKPKKSRAERLAEKEEKRTVSVVLPELEAKKVITELKDVLKIRKPPKQT